MINNFIYDDVSNAILNANTALNEITKSTLALQQNHILFMLILYLKVPLQKLLDII